MPTLILLVFSVAVLSLAPQSIAVITMPDWFAHAVAYGALTAFARLNWPGQGIRIAVCVFLLSFIIEISQSLTPDRSVSVDDLIANMAGIMIVTLWRAVCPVVCVCAAFAVAGCAAFPVPDNIDAVRAGDGYQRTQRDINDTDGAPERHMERTYNELIQCRPHVKYRDYPLLPRQKHHGVLGAGDLIRIEIGEEELISGSYEIETDGALHLPHLSPVHADGLSTEALTHALRDAFVAEGLFRAPVPSISIKILERSAIRVHVSGAVFEPGTVDVAARTAEDRDPIRQDAAGDPVRGFGLTAALRGTAGLRPDAELENILVKRNGKVWRVNMVGAMRNYSFHDPVLHRGDEVHVPSLGCFQPGLARPTVATRKGIKIHLSNLTIPAFSNSQSAIDPDVREVRYGTRLLQALVRMNCVGGTHATNASRFAILISKNPVTGETEVIERPMEDLVRRSDRDSHDPILMPGDAIACYDSKVTNLRDASRSFIDIFSPIPFSRGL